MSKFNSKVHELFDALSELPTSQLESGILKLKHYDILQAQHTQALELLREARGALSDASWKLNSIKYELESSVYTLTDDEFSTVFLVRDCIDETLKSIDNSEVLK